MGLTSIMGSWLPLKNATETQRKVVPGKMAFSGKLKEEFRKRNSVECLDDDLW